MLRCEEVGMGQSWESEPAGLKMVEKEAVGDIGID